MKQVAILPSGVQVLHGGSILHFSEDRILYAATLAVYVLSAKTFQIEKILSLNTRAISSITVSPYDPNLMVVGALDGSVCLWNIEDEEVVSRINTLNGGVFVAWDPFSPQHCSIISNEANLKLFYWDVKKTSGGSLVELFCIKNAVKHTVARFNPNVDGQMAVGCNNGAVILFNHRNKSQKVLLHADPSSATGSSSASCDPVVDIQFDRLSVLYMLVAYTYHIALWDLEGASEILLFDKQTLPITSIAWLDWTAGNFLSTNGRNNHIKIWNASQRQHLEVVKMSSGEYGSAVGEGVLGGGGGTAGGSVGGAAGVSSSSSIGGLGGSLTSSSVMGTAAAGSGDAGINSVYLCPGKKRLLTANMNGSISVFNLGRKQLEFSSSCGHTETIFDCKLNPNNADQFVSTGFDGTIKFWNIHGLTLTRTIPSNNEIIYCIDWHPRGLMVAACTVNGHVILFETESGREVARYQNHLKASYSLAWNKLTDNLIVSTSCDGTVIVMNVNSAALLGGENASQSVSLGSRRKGDTSRDVTPTDIRFQYKHSAALFGVSWCPSHAPLFCCTSQDGIVRVFNHMLGIQFVSLFVGHTGRSFGCAWSTLVRGLLATSSDDCNVNVWQVDLNKCLTVSSTSGKGQGPVSVLKGHIANVRGLQWSYEHESLLLSGSWDSVIRLWDALSGVCLYELQDHIADVYAITSHPLRPFTFLSASRDTTIRLWELEGVVTRLRAQAVFDCSLHRILPASEGAGGSAESKPLDDAPTKGPAAAGSASDLSCSDSLSEYQSKKTVSSARLLITALPATLRGEAAAELNKSLSRASELPSEAIGSNNRHAHLIPRDPLALAKNYYKLFCYFSGASGSMDLWENAIALINSKNNSNSSTNNNSSSSSSSKDGLKLLRSAAFRSVIHEDEVLVKATVEVNRLEAALKSRQRSSKGGEINSRQEELMRAAALQYARLGKFSKYCSLMVELNDYPAALALAPAVSLDYWKELCVKYAAHLAANQSELCIPHLLGTGRDVDAVDFYLRRQEYGNAMTVAKMSEQRVDLIPEHIHSLYSEETTSSSRLTPVPSQLTGGRGGASKAFSFNNTSTAGGGEAKDDSFTPLTAAGGGVAGPAAAAKPPQVRDRTEQEVEDSRLIVRSVSHSVVRELLSTGQPVTAAAHCLSVGDVTTAIQILTNNLEFDQAFALARVFGLDATPHLIDMADRCASLNAITLAVELLRSIENKEVGEVETGLLLSRYCTESKYRRIISQLGLRRIEEWLDRAKEEEAIGSDVECVISFIIGRQHSRAASIGLAALRKHTREPYDLSSNNKRLLRCLKYLKASELSEEPLRASFLATLLWFSAHDAVTLGLLDTAASMLTRLVDTVNQHSNCISNISLTDVKFQLLFVSIAGGNRAAALTTMKALLGEMVSSEGSKAFDSAQRLSNLLNDSKAAAATPNSASYSAAAARGGELCWGKNTTQIYREMQVLSELLSLPSLSSLKGTSKTSSSSSGGVRGPSPLTLTSGSSGVSAGAAGTGGNSAMGATVLQGSLLPSANQKIKSHVSVISSRRITGRGQQLCNELDTAFVTANELVSWYRVNPFSPLMNGDIIYL